MEIDLAVGAFANLGDKLDSISSGLGKLNNRKLVPGLHKTAVGSFVSPASVTTPLILPTTERPAAGRIWNVQGYGIYSTDAHTTVATVIADLFIGSPDIDPINVQPSVLDNIVGNLAVPSTGSFPRQTYWCREGQQPYLVLYSAPVSTPFVLRITYTDYRIQDAEEMVI